MPREILSRGTYVVSATMLVQVYSNFPGTWAVPYEDAWRRADALARPYLEADEAERRRLLALPLPAKELLRGVPGTPLHERLATASFDEPSFCSVAGLSLRPQRAGNQAECRLGDALTMIPPVTGNGMSMAFEAAEIALEPIAAYAQGKVSWTESRRAISHACDKTFGPRLAWAMWLQKMMFSPVLQGGLGGFVLSSSWLWRRMFARTR